MKKAHSFADPPKPISKKGQSTKNQMLKQKIRAALARGHGRAFRRGGGETKTHWKKKNEISIYDLNKRRRVCRVGLREMDKVFLKGRVQFRCYYFFLGDLNWIDLSPRPASSSSYFGPAGKKKTWRGNSAFFSTPISDEKHRRSQWCIQKTL